MTYAGAVLGRIVYLGLSTVAPDGRPWSTPVYYAADGIQDYYWVSSTASRHSVNLASNAAASLVVFDSTVAVGQAQAVYAEGTAGPVPDDGLDQALTVYPGPAGRGGRIIARADLTGPSAWRLYRFRADRVWLLCPRDPGRPCVPHGRNDDHRVRVR